jgi:hypothetical protein
MKLDQLHQELLTGSKLLSELKELVRTHASLPVRDQLTIYCLYTFANIILILKISTVPILGILAMLGSLLAYGILAYTLTNNGGNHERSFVQSR